MLGFPIRVCLYGLPLLLLWCSSPAWANEPTVSLMGAVIKTLEDSPGVLVEREVVEQSRGLLQQATGAFDYVISSSAGVSSSHTPASEAQIQAQAGGLAGPVDTYYRDSDAFTFKVKRQFRTGLSLGTSAATTSRKNNTDQPDMANWSEVKLVFVTPLLKGLGVEATGADETAARISLQAAESLSKYNISQRVFTTVESYWNTWSAERTFQILSDTEKRAQEMVKLVERFIAAGELAPAFIHQVNAKLYARKTDMDLARLKLQQVRQALGQAMGLSPDELQRVPHPDREIPPVVGFDQLARVSSEGYVGLSMKKRGDYLASQAKVKAQEVLTEQARNYTLPSLYFSVEAGYAGRYEDPSFDRHVASAWTDPKGLNTFSGLTLELPVENNEAKGVLARQGSLLRQAKLQGRLLANRIASEVILSLDSLRSSISEYEMATRSTAAYKLAVDDAYNRLLIGEASVFELIDTEDKYFNARVTESEALVKHVIALAKLRFSTGTILKEKEGQLFFSPDCVAALPPALRQEPLANGSGQ